MEISSLGVKYKPKIWKWGTIILNKTQELARFLLEKSGSIDFKQPSPSLVRSERSFTVNEKVADRLVRFRVSERDD